MRMIIDTGVLWLPDALRSLVKLPFDRILPAVAFAERARQITVSGRALTELQDLLDLSGIEVEAFDQRQALRYAPKITDDRDWARLARDALIAGHLGPEDTLWTTDPDDFRLIGVPADRIVTVK